MLNNNQKSNIGINAKKRDRREYGKQRYQKKKEWYRQWHQDRKAQKKENKIKAEQNQKKANDKYYEAANIKILMGLKEYTNLNKEKQKLWLDFNKTLKDIVGEKTLFESQIHSIIEVMKLKESAENLINDYWIVAKNEVKKGKNWNDLDCGQQQKLIRYWSRQKARQEKQLAVALTKQEEQAKTYEKEIELAKYHEERGKINCECYSCQEKKQIHADIKVERDKIVKDYEKQQKDSGDYVTKEECPNCGQIRILDDKTRICKKCSRIM